MKRIRAVADQLTADAEPALVNRCEWLWAWVLHRLGEMEEAFAHAKKARTAYVTLPLSVQLTTDALYGVLLAIFGLNDVAYAEVEQAISRAGEDADGWAYALCVYALSLAVSQGGDKLAARDLSTRSIELARAASDTHLESWFLVNLGTILADMADDAGDDGDTDTYTALYEQAIAVTEDAFKLADANSDSWAVQVALPNAAEYAAYIGQFERAHGYLGQWENAGGYKSARRWAQYYYTLGEVLFREGKPDEALPYCARAVVIAEKLPDGDQKHFMVRLLSDVHEALGDFQTALRLHKRYFNLYRKFEGERVKQRARVAAIMSDTELLKKQAAQSELDALTDPLTGVGNRRRFERVLEAHEAEGYTNFAIAFADLDHFKAINDQFSHAVGDDVIRAFAQLLQESCRIDDLVARVGGEEFVLLLEDTNMRGAAAVCRRLQTRMRKYDWSQIAPGLSVTVSIGVALSSEAGNSRDLLALADARLYRAKAEGRDRVVTEGVEPDSAVVA
ncbi:diguanylate cyclase [Pelagibacterium halotolerans]|uniref:GGDEF domain-containing protein n=1 Tax=Pelagibacterium halotolerans TaxID=531813 RepID=UPI00384AD31A